MRDVRILETSALDDATRHLIRRLMDDAFAGDFSDDDWAHALGGWHAVIGDDAAVLAHASVVPRTIFVGGVAYRAGYVEAVAARPDQQGTGLGTTVMAAVGAVVRERFELGVLSTGEWHFYERLGWERWQGPAFVRGPAGDLRRTPDEDDAVMVLRFGAGAALDLGAPIACDERAGDSW